MKTRYLLLGLTALLLTFALLGLYWQKKFVQTTIAKNSAEFVIIKGLSFNQISKRLDTLGYLPCMVCWKAYAHLTQQSSHFKAGHYQIEPTDTMQTLFQKLVQNKVILDKLTIVDGWTIKQVLQAVQTRLNHGAPPLTRKEILQYLKIKHASAEGWIYPETYLFNRGTANLDILKQGHELMLKTLNQLWKEYPLPLDSPIQTKYELLILASIVEREAFFADEKPMIAKVFLNRLNIKMRLQSDPSVIYGMGDNFKGNIRREDLKKDTPYNTYTRQGLPPTPIGMPNADSIRAVLRPAKTKALYFVAMRDNKKHYFSNTYKEHRKAVYQHQVSPK